MNSQIVCHSNLKYHHNNNGILVSVNKLWVKYVLAHFELEIYTNAWLVAGDEIEQSVSADYLDDPPVETVALTHFELLEFHCNIWLFVKLDIDTSLCFPIDGNVPFNDKLPPDDKLNSFVELWFKFNVPLEF